MRARAAFRHHQGRIVAILPTAQAALRFAAHERIDRPTHVLLPGFINAHVNTALALPPPAGGQARMDPAWADPEFSSSDSTELSIARMIGSGTDLFAHHHLFPDIVAATAATLHVRASIGLPIRGEPTSWATTPDEYFEKASGLHDEYRADPLISTTFATGPTTTLSGAKLFARLRPKADEIELPVVVPLHESAAISQSLQRFGCRPVERLERLDLVHRSWWACIDTDNPRGPGNSRPRRCPRGRQSAVRSAPATPAAVQFPRWYPGHQRCARHRRRPCSGLAGELQLAVPC